MLPLLLIVGAGLGWAWWTGRLKRFTYEDGIALALFLLGLRLLTTGRVLPGAALMAGAVLWAAYRRGRRSAPPRLRQCRSRMPARCSASGPKRAWPRSGTPTAG